MSVCPLSVRHAGGLVTVGRLRRGRGCAALRWRPEGSVLVASVVLKCASRPLEAPSVFIHWMDLWKEGLLDILNTGV